MNKFLIILNLFAIISCNKCITGEGDRLTKFIELESFTGVNINMDAYVTFTQGNEQKVAVTGQENIIEHIQTAVIGGIWEIDFEKECYKEFEELNINIVLPKLKLITINGSSDIDINDFINQEALKININGSGDVVLNGFRNASLLDLNIDGSGSITARSNFEDITDLNIQIDGSGDLFLYPISTPNCDISIDGSGNCEVKVEERLMVSIDGSGEVKYKGSPIVTSSIDGSGELINDN